MSVLMAMSPSRERRWWRAYLFSSGNRSITHRTIWTLSGLGITVICGRVLVWGGWESEKMENEERNGWRKRCRWRKRSERGRVREGEREWERERERERESERGRGTKEWCCYPLSRNASKRTSVASGDVQPHKGERKRRKRARERERLTVLDGGEELREPDSQQRLRQLSEELLHEICNIIDWVALEITVLWEWERRERR